MLPHYRTELARAKAASEDLWRVRAEHDRWLDRLSVVIARHNAVLIRRARWSPTCREPDDEKENADPNGWAAWSEA